MDINKTLKSLKRTMWNLEKEKVGLQSSTLSFKEIEGRKESLDSTLIIINKEIDKLKDEKRKIEVV